MKLISTNDRARRIDWFGLAAWIVFLVLFINVLAFVVRCANPVLMSDDWYFLQVFVRKAIDGDLRFADFFVKRIGPDHSEPFIKMILLWCLRGFDLDISFEALIGVLVALGCVLLFRVLVFLESRSEGGRVRHLAWIAISAIIFSLNGTEIWAWALNSAQYSSFFLVPVFTWSVWRSYCKKEYLLLAGVTLLLAFISDDNAVICIVATLMTLAFYALLGRGGEKGVLLRIFAVVLVCALIVRIGYLYAPLVGGVKDMSLTNKLHTLYSQIEAGQWPKWIATPMIWSIASRSFLPPGHDGLFVFFEYGLFVVMLVLHCWFWLRAIRQEWNLQIFVAISLMLVTYGWIAGVLLYRIPEFGADYFKQDRYVRLYQFGLVALVLMWIGSVSGSKSDAGRKRLTRWGVIACVAFLALQVPMSITAWASVPYRQRYDQDLARQIYRLASNPSDAQVLANCNPQLPLCGMPLEQRESALRLIQDNHLNIFSPKVLLAHPYLLNATSSLDAAGRMYLLSAVQEAEGGKSAENVYGALRLLFSGGRESWPRSGVDINTMSANDVPLMLEGCWTPDGRRHHVSSWCGPEVSLVLQKPVEASKLIIQGWFPRESYVKAGQVLPATFTVVANDVLVARKTISVEGTFTVDVPAHNLPASGPIYIGISVNGSFVPSSVGPSQDSRKLSMKLSSVYFSPVAKDLP